jgi:hypothetical protein
MTLQLRITSAGLAALPAPDGLGTNRVRITSFGVSETPAPLNALVIPGEIKRLPTVSGQGLGDNKMHVAMSDYSDDAYTLRTFGLYLSDGTLFAIYSQNEAIFEKLSAGIMMISADIALTTVSVDSIEFTGTQFNNPPSTESTRGVIELATEAEVLAHNDHERAVTPLMLWRGVSSWIQTWLTSWLANKDVWGRTNDGAGSTLDADLLDGQQGAWYADILSRLGFVPANRAGDAFTGPVTAPALSVAGAPVWTAGNDGAGSGLDADTVDGLQASALTRLNQFSAVDPAFDQQIRIYPDNWKVQTARGASSQGDENPQFIPWPVPFDNAPKIYSVTCVITSASNGADVLYQAVGEPTRLGITVQRQRPGGGADPIMTYPRVTAEGF